MFHLETRKILGCTALLYCGMLYCGIMAPAFAAGPSAYGPFRPGETPPSSKIVIAQDNTVSVADEAQPERVDLDAVSDQPVKAQDKLPDPAKPPKDIKTAYDIPAASPPAKPGNAPVPSNDAPVPSNDAPVPQGPSNTGGVYGPPAPPKPAAPVTAVKPVAPAKPVAPPPTPALAAKPVAAPVVAAPLLKDAGSDLHAVGEVDPQAVSIQKPAPVGAQDVKTAEQTPAPPVKKPNPVKKPKPGKDKPKPAVQPLPESPQDAAPAADKPVPEMNNCAVEREMNKSLVREMSILESEKEALRTRLNQLQPGDLMPVLSCAAESKRIKDLESQIKYLQDENAALKKKNDNLGDAGFSDAPPKHASKSAKNNPEPKEMPSLKDDTQKINDQQKMQMYRDQNQPSSLRGSSRDQAVKLDTDPGNPAATTRTSNP